MLKTLKTWPSRQPSVVVTTTDPHSELLVQKPQKSTRGVLYIVAIVAVGGGMLLAATLASGVPTTNITINGTRTGLLTDGIGAISGGGGNSRLLIDYPEPERTQILDYMFKPGYGASLQILKLEIGGDANSTDGAEPSIEHSRGVVNCNAGYEWWIAEQAVARNPNVKLYGLQWAAPGWVGDGSNTIWTQDDVNYAISWMNCAKSHGLTIGYIGGWNERGYNASWDEKLRTALDNNKYKSTQIVADDGTPGTDWNIASSISANQALRSAVSVVGQHDVCQYPTTGYICRTTATARKLNKPLWAPELGAMDANLNADAMVRAINNGYNQAMLTGFLIWPMVDSMPAGLPHENFGLITADQPWSGNYVVNKMMWAIAQTTQFVPVGWLHVGGANKSIGNSGSYDTYQAPDHSAWTMVTQNTGASAKQSVGPQQIKVKVDGGLPTTAIHVWETNLKSTEPTQWFMHKADVTLTNGAFTYTIPAGYVVTFTTSTNQTAPAVAGSSSTPKPPAAGAQALPYANTLADDDGSGMSALLSPQSGAFGLVSCLGGLSGKCTQQMVPQAPVFWSSSVNTYPYATIGSSGSWKNYTVSTNMLFTKTSDSGGIIGRYSNRGAGTKYIGVGKFDGYMLNVTETGKWEVLSVTPTGNAPKVIASGSVKTLGTDTWHNVALSMHNSKISAAIDSKTVGSITNTAHAGGSPGIEAGAFTSKWPIVQYNDFSVKPQTR